jgi:uncharacterized protein YcbK (DUF882 family)
MTDPRAASRRRFLHTALRRTSSLAAASTLPGWAAAGGATAPSEPAAAGVARPAARSLALAQVHTGERLSLVYALGGRYVPEALGALNRLLRDHYSGEVGAIDPQLFDQLHEVQRALGSTGVFEVISGYRCPATNERLRTTRGGGVARNSLHLQGRAIDVRLAGTPLANLRDAATSLRGGGVGFYPHERFVHLDTGRVRAW